MANTFNKKVCIIGGGNIGSAMLRGFLMSGKVNPDLLTITRRNLKKIEELSGSGVHISNKNVESAASAEIIILAVLPQQMEEVMQEIAPAMNDKKIVASVVSAYTIEEIRQKTGGQARVVRIMANTAAAVCESMTCLAVDKGDEDSLEILSELYSYIGKVLQIPEKHMGAATILAACGIAYFMRYIRAASQGGIQVGFHAHEAQLIAAQTANGASKLLLSSGNHPETEIDKVTTPMGCTIAGLNEMEHNGLSSALIKGIITSYNEINRLK